EIGAPLLAKSWIDDIRCWPAPRPADDGVSLLVAALNAIPKRFGCIGMEMGRESTVRMPLVDFLDMRSRLAHHELVDGSPCLWKIISVKTAAEIRKIREICQLESSVFEKLPDRLAAGRSERDICRDLTIDILQRGADSVHFMAASSGPGGYSQIISRPGRR